ncbi:MAG: hypothetical protein JNL28_16415 [Planctomycetes bacterium]|nr:hypothetical protein [Planctomycetota bacterium]
MKWIVTFIAVLFCLVSGVRAQDKVKVEVLVTTVSGGHYYIDKGRSDGLEIGDRITFRAQSGVSADGTIRAVAKNSARADLDSGSVVIAVGDRGEVFVPRERFARPDAPPQPARPVVTPEQPQPAPDAAPAQDSAPTPVQVPSAPTDPPVWTHPPEEWAKDKPLLAPAFGLRPEERERRLHGRAYLQTQMTRDSQNDSRDYSNSSVGLNTTMENPFGKGGALRFDGTFWTRSTQIDSAGIDETESRLRLNRLNYSVGGTEDDPTRWQFGRFLQAGLPEFGLLDGVEWNRRLAGGDDIGASIGAMPQPFSALSSFEDTQAAVFYRHALDDKRRNALAIGYQNTWHKGDQDRNLFVGEARLQPGDNVSIRSTAWVDVYGSEDTIKDNSFELTEFLVALSWRTTVTSGLGVTLSHRKIPELARSEFQSYDADTVRDARLDRIALNGWMNVTPKVRVDGRVDHWRDQDDSGSSGEAGVALRDILWEQGELRASAFYADGSFSSGPGARLTASKSFGRTSASLGYEYIDYSQKGFAGVQQTLAQQALFGTLDFRLFESWDLSLIGDKRFGDEQDSYTLGFMLQTRF